MSNQPKRTPGRWKAYLSSNSGWIVDTPGPNGLHVVTCGVSVYSEGNAKLIASLPDYQDMLTALILQEWSVRKASLYDEEGVEGWIWTDAGGIEYTVHGSWDELPSWPDAATLTEPADPQPLSRYYCAAKIADCELAAQNSSVAGDKLGDAHFTGQAAVWRAVMEQLP